MVDPDKLKSLRDKRSREVIAHALRSRGHATDAKAIWRWENGRNQPSATVLPDYAAVLGVDDVRELYEDVDDEEESMRSDDLATVLRMEMRRLLREEMGARR